jgi:nucleotide-binding universal stress UspA family protein
MSSPARQASAGSESPTVEPAGRCLVVGYDGSESARAAASWAAGWLLPQGKLVLVYASRPLHAPASPLATAEERHKLGQAFLDELALDGDDALVDVTAHAEVLDEDPVSALIEAARRHQASGIVVGRQQHSRLRTAIGTVTSELLMRSPVPVTAVPGARGSA